MNEHALIDEVFDTMVDYLINVCVSPRNRQACLALRRGSVRSQSHNATVGTNTHLARLLHDTKRLQTPKPPLNTWRESAHLRHCMTRSTTIIKTPDNFCVNRHTRANPQEHEEEFPPSRMSQDMLQWAHDCFLSRALKVPGKAGSHTEALTPLVDILNHRPGALTEFTRYGLALYRTARSLCPFSFDCGLVYASFFSRGSIEVFTRCGPLPHCPFTRPPQTNMPKRKEQATLVPPPFFGRLVYVPFLFA